MQKMVHANLHISNGTDNGMSNGNGNQMVIDNGISNAMDIGKCKPAWYMQIMVCANLVPTAHIFAKILQTVICLLFTLKTSECIIIALFTSSNR